MVIAFERRNRHSLLPADRVDGSRCHGYFDLKKDISLISKIPELEKQPELRSLIREINASTPYRTAGCLTWACASQPGEPRRRKAGSYVDLCFEEVARNKSRTIFEDICAEFKQFVADQHTETVGVEFEIHPVTFRDDNDFNGWATAIFVYGYGASGLDARKSWKRGIRALREFFKSLRARLR